MVGTAITIAIADGSKAAGALADVHYVDAWAEGRFLRRTKLDWLRAGADAGTLPNAVVVRRGLLDDMRPAPFQNGDWISLRDCFTSAFSGIQTKRDHLVYAPTHQRLMDQLEEFLRLEQDQDLVFNSTAMNPASRARLVGLHADQIRPVAYRPLDIRFHYTHPAWNDRLRTEMQRAWGMENLALFSMPGGTKDGPATWCHARCPDYHAFRGSYGGYVLPLFDRRAGPNATNFSADLLRSLSAAYGASVSAIDAFDAVLCLLSATSYTRRFAEDLEDVFPHVPFPADHAVFARAVETGRDIRSIETFTRAPPRRMAGFCRLASEPVGQVISVSFTDGQIDLCEGGAGRITGIPHAVWEFSVSGYRLLPRWIEGRLGLPADLVLVRDLRDVAGRIAELIELFAQADTVLDATLARPLTREALGLVAETEGDDGDAG